VLTYSFLIPANIPLSGKRKNLAGHKKQKKRAKRFIAVILSKTENYIKYLIK
jgi:hypothetical protein